MYDDRDEQTDKILSLVVNKWLDQLEHARKIKDEKFSAAASECMGFYNGPKDWEELMTKGFIGNDEEMPEPLFRISINKAFEYVQLFGPALYYENPVRTVKPRMPVDIPPDLLPPQVLMYYSSVLQQEQQKVRLDGLRAVLVGAYLNWLPRNNNLSESSREAINEALIKGRSCVWTELDTPPNADFKIVRSSWDSVDNLLIDPDAKNIGEALWIARRCVHPVWQVERDYGWPKGSIKPNSESLAVQADIEMNTESQDLRRRGKSNDLLVYWKIWSKMGIGGRLPQVKDGVRESLEVFGDYCYIVVAKGVRAPLNLPPSLVDQQYATDDELRRSVFTRAAWPTPFWADGKWPVALLDFIKIPNSVWPMPPLKAGMGELKFLNWAYSFLAGHIRNSAREFIVMLKSLPEEVKNGIIHGSDHTVVEIDSTQNKPFNELIQFLQHPPLNKDIYTIIEKVSESFDKRMGLTELMYGTSGVQLRSAEEAAVKQQNMSVRPEDMAKQVETWQAEIAAREAMCARFHLSQKDVEHVVGSMGSWAWVSYCSTSDPQLAARQLEYQIESGSTQKPNKNFEIRQMTEAFTSLSPIFMQYASASGDVTPINNLLSDFAKSRDLDPARYQLQTPVLPPPSSQPAGGTGAAQQEPTSNPMPQG